MEKINFKRIAAAILLCVAVCLSACSSGKSADTETDGYTSDESYLYAGSRLNSKSSGEIKNLSDGEENTVSEESLETNRKLIKTVSYSLETESFDVTVEELRNRVKEFGGYIESLNIFGGSTNAYSSRSANITIRVPADKLEDFCSEAEKIGNVISVSEEVEDVTLNYTDTEAKVKALETKRDTYIAMLEKAETVEDILKIQSYLSDAEEELEQYKSRLLVLNNLIDYSTVELSLYEVTTYTEPEPETFGQRISQEFKDSLESVGEFFTDTTVFIIGNIPGILTTVLIIGLNIGIIILIIRACRKHKNKKKNKEISVEYEEKKESK